MTAQQLDPRRPRGDRDPRRNIYADDYFGPETRSNGGRRRALPMVISFTLALVMVELSAILALNPRFNPGAGLILIGAITVCSLLLVTAQAMDG